MIQHLFKRLFINVLTLVGILVFTFFLLHILPGGPFDQERTLPKDIQKNLYEKYHLSSQGDDSLIRWFSKDLKSYATYLSDGNLGPSLKYKDEDVIHLMIQSSKPSLILGSLALISSLIGGIYFGILCASHRGRKLDIFIQTLSTFSYTLPTFVTGILLMMIFSLHLQWFPPALWESPLNIILPVICLSLTPMAYITQLTRTSLLDVLDQDYIRTAKAKGLSDHLIFLKHALKNAISPILTLFGPLAASLITGSFIVETLFSIPGLGKHFVTAVIDRDYFLVMGITLFYGSLIILLNWIVDLLYPLLHPGRYRS